MVKLIRALTLIPKVGPGICLGDVVLPCVDVYMSTNAFYIPMHTFIFQKQFVFLQLYLETPVLCLSPKGNSVSKAFRIICLIIYFIIIYFT